MLLRSSLCLFEIDCDGSSDGRGDIQRHDHGDGRTSHIVHQGLFPSLPGRADTVLIDQPATAIACFEEQADAHKSRQSESRDDGVTGITP
jgi:hypothetical protein